jgi:hypothetical protein
MLYGMALLLFSCQKRPASDRDAAGSGVAERRAIGLDSSASPVVVMRRLKRPGSTTDRRMARANSAVRPPIAGKMPAEPAQALRFGKDRSAR